MMKQVKREIEIHLERIELLESGLKLDKHTTHQVDASLIWPRTGIAKKTGSQLVNLDYAAADLASVQWGKKILLRESTEGRFALGVTVSEALDYEKLEKFLRECFRIGIKAGGSLAASYSGGLSKFVTAPFEATAKLVGTYPGPQTLAEGMTELHSDELPQPGCEKLLILQLFSTQSLIRTSRRKVKGVTKTTKKILMREGDPNGTVTLRIVTLES